MIADTGAGVSAITMKLACEMGVEIEEVTKSKVVSQADGTEFSFLEL